LLPILCMAAALPKRHSQASETADGCYFLNDLPKRRLPAISGTAKNQLGTKARSKLVD